jgi:hypothetical protein
MADTSSWRRFKFRPIVTQSHREEELSSAFTQRPQTHFCTTFLLLLHIGLADKAEFDFCHRETMR